MADQAVNEMISAFSAGCMDKENLKQFVDYIESHGELPYKELGKMQTLISMLPVILEPEHPSVDLKNKVARALISMQDEIKEKIKKEKRTTVEFKPAHAHAPVPETVNEEEPLHRPTVEKRETTERIDLPQYIPEPPRQENFYMKENKLFSETPQRIFEGQSLTPVWIVVALIFLAVCGLGYYIFSSNSALKESLARTENSITAIKGELRNAGEYINRNSALVDFFNNENVWVVTLTGSDPSLKISGKLYIAPNEREALLQMNNLPIPSPDNMYQLWLITKQQTYSIGNFFYEPASRYVKMVNLPQVPRDQILRFQISLEPRGGSPLPAGMVYATGNVTESAVKGVKRK